MSKIVSELKKDHLAFITLIESIKGFGPEEQKKLASAKKAFLDHLKKEDLHFYPVLKKGAEKNSDLQGKLGLFANDMEKLSNEMLALFSKYEKGGTAMEFARDWGRVVTQLKTRMRREEEVLHAEFEKLAS